MSPTTQAVKQDLPYISQEPQEALQILRQRKALVFLQSETREAFSGEFPLHTRFFSNGDRPLVVLLKRSGQAVFRSPSAELSLNDGDMLIFDDSLAHGWSFVDASVEIHYFRETEPTPLATQAGDYCLDDFFASSESS